MHNKQEMRFYYFKVASLMEALSCCSPNLAGLREQREKKVETRRRKEQWCSSNFMMHLKGGGELEVNQVKL